MKDWMRFWLDICRSTVVSLVANLIRRNENNVLPEMFRTRYFLPISKNNSLDQKTKPKHNCNKAIVEMIGRRNIIAYSRAFRAQALPTTSHRSFLKQSFTTENNESIESWYGQGKPSNNSAKWSFSLTQILFMIRWCHIRNIVECGSNENRDCRRAAPA